MHFCFHTKVCWRKHSAFNSREDALNIFHWSIILLTAGNFLKGWFDKLCDLILAFNFSGLLSEASSTKLRSEVDLILQVSNIGLGSLKAFSSEDCEMNEDLVTFAFENGINFFDISEPFTSKRAEVELGRIIKKKGWSRRQFVVCTKVYWDK